MLGGCTGLSVGTEQAGLGEPSGDYPNYDERVVLYATNRARVDPAKEGWSSYSAQPPLEWNDQLNQSARAHSIDMRDTPCFQHNSCDGGDIWKRITSYYTTPYMSIGENISAGVPDGLTAVHNWLYEIGAPAGETGHRDNIFSADFTLMGVGFAEGGTQYQNYWTQDFIGNPVQRPQMGDGIHFPKSGSQVTFGVTWSADAAPASIDVVVDGKCSPLTLQRGGGGQAAYEAMLPVTTGCHAYYFFATTASGEAVRYPDAGSLQVGSAGSSCNMLYVASQMPADCDGTTPQPQPSSPPDLGTSDGLRVHLGGGDMAQPPSEQPPSSMPPGSQPPSSTPPDMRAGGCSVAGGAVGAPWLLLSLTLFCWWLLRRRRAR